MRIGRLKESAVAAGAALVCPRISLGVLFGGVAVGYGFWSKRTMRIAIVLTLILSTCPAWAKPTLASGEEAFKERAVLDFRIVIPETLSIDPRTTRRLKSQPYMSRTTQYRDGRLVVTLATP